MARMLGLDAKVWARDAFIWARLKMNILPILKLLLIATAFAQFILPEWISWLSSTRLLCQ